MTANQIAKAQARAQLPFEAAIRIREVLDGVRKAYGAELYDSDNVEDQILELVTTEE